MSFYNNNNRRNVRFTNRNDYDPIRVVTWKAPSDDRSLVGRAIKINTLGFLETGIVVTETAKTGCKYPTYHVYLLRRREIIEVPRSGVRFVGPPLTGMMIRQCDVITRYINNKVTAAEFPRVVRPNCSAVDSQPVPVEPTL